MELKTKEDIFCMELSLCLDKQGFSFKEGMDFIFSEECTDILMENIE